MYAYMYIYVYISKSKYHLKYTAHNYFFKFTSPSSPKLSEMGNTTVFYFPT